MRTYLKHLNRDVGYVSILVGGSTVALGLLDAPGWLMVIAVWWCGVTLGASAALMAVRSRLRDFDSTSTHQEDKRPVSKVDGTGRP